MGTIDNINAQNISGNSRGLEELLFEVIEALLGDPTAALKIGYKLAKTPFFLQDKLLWAKIEQYLNGVYVSEEDRAKLRAKLTEDGSSDENSKRLLQCIDRAETKRKIQYLINVTRCFLTDFIDRTTFFRICHVITTTIDEDLMFVRDHIMNPQDFVYSPTIQGLFVSGLVTLSVIGGETTQYAFTPLAEDVDRFAISYDNVERYPNPIAHRAVTLPRTSIPTMSADEIDEIVAHAGEESKAPKIEVEIPVGEF